MAKKLSKDLTKRLDKVARQIGDGKYTIGGK